MIRFSPATAAWFEGAFTAATPIQERGWEAISAGRHSLLVAPTGSGKTLAAFLWCIDELANRTRIGPGVQVLYVSPLKALVYDIDRNLRSPLAGIAERAKELGIDLHLPRIDVRTGDTSAKARRQQGKHPGQILVTTPESLYLLLGSKARETLRTVTTVIIDEAHALAPSKRGAHLSLSLERLARLCERDPQRIGLSATARPAAEVARFIGGDRAVEIVDASVAPALDLQIVVPARDMSRPADANEGDDQRPGERGIWPTILPRLVELIREHSTTIIFVNSRGLCERLCHRINEHAGEELVRSHHGSLAHSERRHIEEQLKAGSIAGIVATSSLELGIDMGAVDLVILVESPSSVSSGLQRVGRSGHRVGERSKGRLFPKHRGDLLEALVVGERMRRGQIEALSIPRGALDVLAQQIVAMVASEDWEVSDLADLVRRAAGYRELPDSALEAVLDMLSGRYPSTAFADLRPRLVWNREAGTLSARPGAKMISLVNGGTIPNRGMYGVYLEGNGPRVGELDEEMVNETTPGQTFTLGATTWRVEQITRDRVVVSPAPGEQGKLPFWRGDGPGRPLELGRALGAFVARLAEMPRAEAIESLREDHGATGWAAENAVDFVAEQLEACGGAVPTDRCVVIERFRDELGDWRLCILTPFGSRVHAPWALAIKAAIADRTGVSPQIVWSDDGIVLRLGDDGDEPDIDVLVPDPDEVGDLVTHELAHSPVFAGQFRENAARALLLPRRRPGSRTPLWLQRLKSQQLLAIALEFPSFPIVIETYRSCLKDVFDLPALSEVLSAIHRRDIRVESIETSGPSPFARSLIFSYVGAYLYEGDAPMAERRAQALSLDRELLRELLGEQQIRELLDPDVIVDTESELSSCKPGRQARSAEELCDVLRRLGDLSPQEIEERTTEDPSRWLTELEGAGRAVRVELAAQQRWIAAEDAALYRDALGIPVPQGVHDSLLEAREQPMAELLGRFSRTRGPFEAETFADRYALPAALVRESLEALAHKGALVSGPLAPGRDGVQWCDAEILRRLKKRTLARLRSRVSPLPPATLGRFLPSWHGIDKRIGSRARLQEVVAMLEGLPLPYSELERTILPARIADFRPAMLDELGATGFLVWVGHGPLGARDGRIALYRRDRVADLLAPVEEPTELSALSRRLLEHLRARGASFLTELCQVSEDADLQAVNDALWELVWAGLVTNDSLTPLRHLSVARRSSSAGRHRRSAAITTAGRWSLVGPLLDPDRSATARAHALSLVLLDRHGIVTREVAALEELPPGGFHNLYSVLGALEEAGRVRRGYFVAGLGGAQFALPGAVDRLRRVAEESGGGAIALAACDPANPYGWLLPWPLEGSAPRKGPRRAAGATVVLYRGRPVLFLDKGGKRLLTFPAASDDAALAAAARTLVGVAARRRGKYLRIETIDHEPARQSPTGAALLAHGFFADHRGLVLEVR